MFHSIHKSNEFSYPSYRSHIYVIILSVQNRLSRCLMIVKNYEKGQFFSSSSFSCYLKKISLYNIYLSAKYLLVRKNHLKYYESLNPKDNDFLF